jgi:plastocyanin
MRFSKFVVAGVFVLAACGKKDDTTTQTSTTTPAATTPPATAQGAPITGTTHVVQMVGDDKGSRFEPNTITVKQGDGIRFDAISMSPHNVSFDPAALSPEAKAALVANMPSQDMGELQGKLLNNGENYTISFGNVPPGTYEAICTPHASTGMKMKITVQ